MKIVFTGGHHNASLEVAKKIKEIKPEIEIIWYGHKHTTLQDSSLSGEYKEVTASGIMFRDIKAGKVYKTYNINHWLRLPFGFFQSFFYLLKDKPKLIVSFGGYLAVPVVLASWIQRKPAVTHEQTYVAGLANRFIGKFAKKIFLTWESSRVYFNPKKSIVTGLPLRSSIFKINPNDFVFNNSLPIVYVTGGKQGSHGINMAVKDTLTELLKITNIIHQTGSTTEYDDFKALTIVKNSLPSELKERYIIREYVFENEIGSVLNKSNIVISRSGGHMIYELIALHKPAILIPIPWSSHNEQFKNAEMLKNNKGAEILEQKNLSGLTLQKEVENMLKNIDKYKDTSAKNKHLIKTNALDKIVNEIIQLI